MFMVSSRITHAERINNTSVTNQTLLLIADADLFSECLVEALGKKFPMCNVISISQPQAIEDGYTSDVKLVLFYRIAGQQLQDALINIREKHPSASIGLVIDAVGMLESYLKQLVETRIIDGVLPLSLRLDVFMAAVDLLIKGGEHFPSALLGRLVETKSSTNSMPHAGTPIGLASAAKQHHHDFNGLTTREVQILDLLCKGTQNKIIANKLHLSENTVKVHVRNIYKKMHVRNRTEAASRFFAFDHAEMAHHEWKN